MARGVFWLASLPKQSAKAAYGVLGRVFVAHPGEVHEAEAFCTKVQRDIAADAHRGAELKGRVLMVSIVHTDVNMFIRSQPTISEVCRSHDSGAYTSYVPHRPDCSLMLLLIKKSRKCCIITAEWCDPPSLCTGVAHP